MMRPPYERIMILMWKPSLNNQISNQVDGLNNQISNQVDGVRNKVSVEYIFIANSFNFLEVNESTTGKTRMKKI